MTASPLCGVTAWQTNVGAFFCPESRVRSGGMKGQMGLFLISSSSPKNFTTLIPGTTVEILHGDSKNIIQLIINAYNVSHQFLPHRGFGSSPGLRWAAHRAGVLGSAC